MRYAFRIDGREHKLNVEEHAGGPKYVFGESNFTPDVKNLGGGKYEVTIEGDVHRFTIQGGRISDSDGPLDLEIRRARPQLVRAGGKGRGGDGRIKPPMPGKIAEIHVKEGDVIEDGQPLLVLEAMKMQNDIKAPFAGTVEKVHVKEGQNVESTTIMVEIAAATEE
jgi:biotin carboxyl carrier protein